MEKSEFEYYEEIGNWDFSNIHYKTIRYTNWDYFEEIKKHTNENSICLDLGTGGGEEVLKNYPIVKKIIATDFSNEMIKTANENLKKFPDKNVKFLVMDNLKIEYPEGFFDLISARHTVINAKEIFRTLKKEGALIIEGVDQKDCWELKELFNKGQGYTDEIPISEKDYMDLKEAGFNKIEKKQILEDEYYKTKEDLMALLLKAPILDDFSEINETNFEHIELINKELFNKYVEQNTTQKGILLKRVLYGIVAIK